METGKQADRPNLYDRPIFGDGGKQPPKVQQVAIRPKRRMSLNFKLFLFAVVFFAAAAAAAYLALKPEEERYVLDTFQYATVGVRDFRNVVHTAGRVVPSEVIVLTAPANVVVREMFHQTGEDVAADSLLATFHSEELDVELEAAERALDIAVIEADQVRLQHEQKIAAARAEVEKAAIALADAESKLPVMEELYNLGGIPRQEWEATQAAVRDASLALGRAEESLDLAERERELAVKKAEQQVANARTKLSELLETASKLAVVAPAGGRILEATRKPGDRMTQGETLFRIADVTTQYVETVVTPEQAAGIRVGAPALIRTSDAQYPARVAQVAPLAVAADSGTQVPVRLEVAPDVAARFLPYAPVTVEIEQGVLASRPYLVRGPFFTSGNASLVYVLNEDHTVAERRDVRYGAIDGNFIEVISGLEPGDEIIYSSYTAFRSYRSIELIPEGGRPVD